MYLYCVKYYPSLLKNTIQLAENLLPYVKFELEWKLFQGQTNVFVRKNSSAFSIITWHLCWSFTLSFWIKVEIGVLYVYFPVLLILLTYLTVIHVRVISLKASSC